MHFREIFLLNYDTIVLDSFFQQLLPSFLSLKIRDVRRRDVCTSSTSDLYQVDNNFGLAHMTVSVEYST